jgi:hypothetical protein
MKKDKREIKLDPMEWRDAMRDVDKKKPKPAAGKGAKGGKKPATRVGAKRGKGR